MRERRDLIGARRGAARGPPTRRRSEAIERARTRLRTTRRSSCRSRWRAGGPSARRWPATPRRRAPDGLLAAFDARLPFALTDGQREVGGADRRRPRAATTRCTGCCRARSARARPSWRCGRCCTVVDAGGQAALLAPTEVLAAQHHRSITAMLGDLAEARHARRRRRGTRVALLTGSQPAAGAPAGCCSRRPAARPASWSARTRCSRTRSSSPTSGWWSSTSSTGSASSSGTRCAAKGRPPPHLLVMTATPIPRTVAMTVFGDLDDLHPARAARRPVADHDARRPGGDDPRWLARAWQRVREEVDGGHQAFVVCPRIGGDDASDDDELGAGRRRRRSAAARRPAAGACSTCSTALRDEPALAGLRVERAARAAAGRGEGRRRWRRSRPARSTCWSRPPSSRSASTSPNATVDGGPGRRPVRRLPAAPAARPGRARVGARAVPAGHRGRRRTRPARERLDAVAATTRRLRAVRGSTWSSAARATCSARRSPGRSLGLRLLRVLRDEERDRAAREDAAAGGRRRPASSPRHPALATRCPPARRARSAA